MVVSTPSPSDVKSVVKKRFVNSRPGCFWCLGWCGCFGHLCDDILEAFGHSLCLKFVEDLHFESIDKSDRFGNYGQFVDMFAGNGGHTITKAFVFPISKHSGSVSVLQFDQNFFFFSSLNTSTSHCCDWHRVYGIQRIQNFLRRVKWYHLLLHINRNMYI